MQEWESDLNWILDTSSYIVDTGQIVTSDKKRIFCFIQEQLDKAREETAMEIIEWIEEEGTVEYLNHGEPCEVYEVTPNDIQQLKAKYKGVGYV